MNGLPVPSIKRVAAVTEAPKRTKPITKPKWRNQEVVRSDQKDSGYVYNDWRNW